jgi:hypothetical protein
MDGWMDRYGLRWRFVWSSRSCRVDNCLVGVGLLVGLLVGWGLSWLICWLAGLLVWVGLDG